MNKAVTGCLPFAALTMVGVLAWPVLSGLFLSKALVILWIVGFGSLSLAKFRLELGRRDTYDLRELRKIHDVAAVPPAQSHLAYCVNCGDEFDGRIPQCPKCKTPQGSGPNG